MTPNLVFTKIERFDKEIIRIKERQISEVLVCIQSFAQRNRTDLINEVLEGLQENQQFYILAPIVRWLGTEYDANYYEDWYESYAFADDR